MERLQEALRETGIAAPGIEHVRTGFPSRNQVRYFHDEDVDAARDVAALFAATLGTTPSLVRVEGYEGKAGTRGLTEVWFSLPQS